VVKPRHASPDVRPLTPADITLPIREAVTPLMTLLAAERARCDSLQSELREANRRLVEVLMVRIPWWRRWFR
jgi:hypothetical protein